MAKKLADMTVKELEAESYHLTTERQAIRQKGIAVQKMLGKRVEDRRASRLLGREVKVVDA